MENIHPVSFVLIAIIILFSYFGFRDRNFFERFKFNTEFILRYKQYYRLLTSGFLHANWMHLFFNLISLFLFSNLITDAVGIIPFLIIYFSSLIGGDLLSLFIHRNHPDYSSIGASGAVNGIIFAAIALHPGMELSLMLFPVFIPAWLFGLLYVLVSMYGIKSNQDNIGHDAHLGGAIIGILTAVIMYPEALKENYFTIMIIFIPAVVFIYLIVTRPNLLLFEWKMKDDSGNYFSIDHKYNEEKWNNQKELDCILDKIGKSGIESLTSKEKSFLDQNSRK
jgi:membrane associated rhomboid family serine protease